MIAPVADHYTVRPDPTSEKPVRVYLPVAGPFVMVMRDDTAYFSSELGRRLTLARSGGAQPPGSLAIELAEGYRGFQRDLREAFRRTWRRPGGIAFHLLDARRLELAVRHRVGGDRLISLDPLITRGASPLEVSRGYLLGGRTAVGLVPRPGAASLSTQIASLRGYASAGCTLIEDDMCTGETIASVVRLLQAAGIPVRRVVPGIRLDGGALPGLAGTVVEPVLQYRTAAGHDSVGAAAEVTDPRNYLFGLSGLAVRLPGAGWGRAPYWLPFVRTSARVGIPTETEKEFARLVLEANLRFFARAERLLRRTMRIVDLLPPTRELMHSLQIADPLEPVRRVLEELMTRLDRWIELIADIEEGDTAARAQAGGHPRYLGVET